MIKKLFRKWFGKKSPAIVREGYHDWNFKFMEGGKPHPPIIVDDPLQEDSAEYRAKAEKLFDLICHKRISQN